MLGGARPENLVFIIIIFFFRFHIWHLQDCTSVITISSAYCITTFIPIRKEISCENYDHSYLYL